MGEDTRSFLNLIEATQEPRRPYITPIPKDGTVYDYRFIKEDTGR